MITPVEVHLQRLSLYQSGASDKEIAHTCYICPQAVRMWRRTLGLPANEKKTVKLDIRMFLYAHGLSDVEIAIIESCSRRTIRVWRVSRGLATNFEGSRKSDEDVKRILEIYQSTGGDFRVAQD